MRIAAPLVAVVAAVLACSSPPAHEEDAPASREPSFRDRALREVMAPPASEEATPAPLELDQAIRESLAASRELDQIRYRIAGAAEQVGQAEASLYPRLVLSEAYTRTDNPVYAMMNIINQRRFTPNIDFNDPGWEQNFATGVRAEWMLLDRGNRDARDEAARLQQGAMESELMAARNQLVGAVTETFYRWLQALDSIRVADLALKEASQNVQLAEARRAAQAALESEVLRLKSREAEAKSNRVSAQASARRFQAAMERFLARKILPGEIPNPADQATLPAFPQEQPDDWVQQALIQRPEIAAVDYLVRAARSRIQDAKGDLWPQVGVFAQYQWDSQRLHNFEGSWMLGANATYPLFEGGLTSARVRGAEAGLRQMEAHGQQVALDIALEVHQASLSLEESRAKISTAADRREWARRALEETRASYEQEVVTVDSLLQSELEWNRAETAYAAALFEGRISVALLRQALGDFADWIEGAP